MEVTKENIDDLIAKYLAGEALPDEAILLDEWKGLSTENKLYYKECEKTFQLLHPATSNFTPTDKDILFRSVYNQLGVNGTRTATRPKIYQLPRYIPLRIAATLLVFTLIGILAAYFFKGRNLEPEVLIATEDKTEQKQLADGSTVFLNKNTKLTVESFNKKVRKLRLEGEAFFEVIHDENKPFIIDAGGVEIKDIGTAFNVKAEPSSDSVSIFVTEGVVEVSNDKVSLHLQKNQSVLYIRSTNQLHEILNTGAQNITAYKTRFFEFNASTLTDVIQSLNEVYGKNTIVLENPELGSCLITVEFNNERIETIVQVITETLGLSYQKTDNTYFITGTACIQ